MKTLFITALIVLSFNFCHGQEQSGITTIILVRHAEKLDDGTNPDLSPIGHQRALRLKSIFTHSDINAIYSTSYKRTINTLAPLAQENGLEIQEYNPSAKDFVQSIYEKNIGKTVLISGHSNTTPMAVNKLMKTNKYENIDHDEYGRIFIVTITDTSKTSVLEIRY